MQFTIIDTRNLGNIIIVGESLQIPAVKAKDSLVARPHLSPGKGQVNQVKFLWLEAHCGMYNHCLIQQC